MNLTASDVMNRDVVTFQRDTSVREAFRIIATKNFSGAPVINDDDELIGVVTEKDLLASISLASSTQESVRPGNSICCGGSGNKRRYVNRGTPRIFRRVRVQAIPGSRRKQEGHWHR